EKEALERGRAVDEGTARRLTVHLSVEALHQGGDERAVRGVVVTRRQARRLRRDAVDLRDELGEHALRRVVQAGVHAGGLALRVVRGALGVALLDRRRELRALLARLLHVLQNGRVRRNEAAAELGRKRTGHVGAGQRHRRRQSHRQRG